MKSEKKSILLKISPKIALMLQVIYDRIEKLDMILIKPNFFIVSVHVLVVVIDV